MNKIHQRCEAKLTLSGIGNLHSLDWCRSREGKGQATHLKFSDPEVAWRGGGGTTSPGLLLFHWPFLGVGGASLLVLLSVYICREDVNTS